MTITAWNQHVIKNNIFENVNTLCTVCILYTVRKEIKCSGDSEILNEIICDTTPISSCFYDLNIVSQTISFSKSMN